MKRRTTIAGLLRKAVPVLLSFLMIAALFVPSFAADTFTMEEVPGGTQKDVIVNGENRVIYCMQYDYVWPVIREGYGSPQTQYWEASEQEMLLNADQLAVIRRVLYAGYPYDAKGFMAPLYTTEDGAISGPDMAADLTQHIIWTLMAEWGITGNEHYGVTDSSDREDDLPEWKSAMDAIVEFALSEESMLDLPDEFAPTLIGTPAFVCNEEYWMTGALSISNPQGFVVSYSVTVPDGVFVLDENGEMIVPGFDFVDGEWVVSPYVIFGGDTFYLVAYDPDYLEGTALSFEGAVKVPSDVKQYSTTDTVRANKEDGQGYVQHPAQTMLSIGIDSLEFNGSAELSMLPEISCTPDVVVIDYGIPVDVNVIDNDMIGDFGTLVAIGSAGSTVMTSALPTGFGESVQMNFGKAELVDGKIRYQLDNMKMTSPDVIWYAVKYENPNAASLNGYYYSTLTVVPATTIYFEESFVNFDGDWTDAGSISDKHQDEDRPGFVVDDAFDANNVYGHDGNYNSFITYSYGSAKRVTVSAANNPTNGGEWPTATFTFTGTGFDIISVTDKTTGTFLVSVEGENFSDRWIVDAYYGMTRSIDSTNPYLKAVWTVNANGTWRVKRTEVADKTLAKDEIDITESGIPASAEVGTKYVIFEDNVKWATESQTQSADVYQVPVLKSGTLAFGTYTVTITPQYATFFDHTGEGSYDFYLDAIRIYDPANNSDAVIDYYLQDNEAFPQYIEIRDRLIFGNVDGTASGAVFIDGCGLNGTMGQFTTFGPNNEVYLDKGQAIAFVLQNDSNMAVASVQVSAKALNGATSFVVGDKTIALATATDLYYDITSAVEWNDNGTSKTIVISNPSGKPVALTNIKITFKPTPAAAPAPMRMLASAEIAEEAVAVMQAAYYEINGADKPAEIRLYGDANNDGKISGLDLASIRRYLANYDYEAGTSASAIGDETLSVRDLGKIRQYLAAYDYATGTSGYELKR